MKYFLALVGTLLCTSQSGFAISQYEIEQKPTQYQLAYSSDTLPQQRLAKDYGQHVAALNSPSQRIGKFIFLVLQRTRQRHR